MFSRFVTMEGLMERLERAVTRLEQLSVNMQTSSGLANGDCVNGIDGGKCMLQYHVTQRRRTEVGWTCTWASELIIISLSFRQVSVCGGLRRAVEGSSVRLPQAQQSHRKRRGETCEWTQRLFHTKVYWKIRNLLTIQGGVSLVHVLFILNMVRKFVNMNKVT